MKHYCILLTTPFFTWTLDPTKISGLPEHPPVDMDALVAILATMNFEDLQEHVSRFSNVAQLVGRVDPGNPENEEAMFSAINQGGVAIFKRYCSVRVVPRQADEDAPQEAKNPSPITATTQAADCLLLHRDVAKYLMIKLMTVQTEVTEALEAMRRVTNGLPLPDPHSPLRDYLPLELPVPAIDAMLHLARLDRDSYDLFPCDLFSPSIRASLQTITHELTKAPDGFGHTLFDSTASQLLLEYQGAEDGDTHEQMLAQALGSAIEHKTPPQPEDTEHA